MKMASQMVRMCKEAGSSGSPFFSLRAIGAL